MWLTVASINLAVAVMLGAFGAHALQARLSLQQLQWWHTSTQYYFYHGLGLLIIALLIRLKLLPSLPAYFMQLGIIIFCGSLYLMALGAPRWFGAITPIDGVCFIMAWLSLAYFSLKSA